MDSLLLIENTDEKLAGALKRMGYKVHEGGQESAIEEIVHDKLVNLIIIDSRAEFDALELCRKLRESVVTRRTPIVYLAKDEKEDLLCRSQKLNRVEAVKVPYSLGQVASKVAVHTRVSKIHGAKGKGASLIEINAALRDLNKRMEKELAQARVIQEALLPPTLPGDERFELHAHYTPLEEIGGDFYSVRDEESGWVSVQIADVTGHGIAAAMLGSMTKLAISAAEREQPDELMDRINCLMEPQLPSDNFVTMQCYRYNPDTGELHLASGGHPPALHLKRSNNEVVEIKAQGFAIGFLDEGMYVLENTALEVGDILVVYTDGFPEARNRAGEFYSEEGLKRVMLGLGSDADAEAACQAILKDFEVFCDGKQLKDDVTLVALRRLQ